MYYLKDPLLVATKQSARAGGVKFSRAAVIRATPFVEVSLSAAVNALARSPTVPSATNKPKRQEDGRSAPLDHPDRDACAAASTDSICVT